MTKYNIRLVKSIYTPVEIEAENMHEAGWHCIIVWECELKPLKREETLDSIAFTLNHIWLQDHHAKVVHYPSMDEEDMQIQMAAENINETYNQWNNTLPTLYTNSILLLVRP